MNRKIGDLGHAARYRMFENYVRPFLDRPNDLKGSEIAIFFDIAERRFFNGIGKEEGRAVRSYLNACNRVYSSGGHKDALEQICAATLAEVEYDATYRINQVLGKEADNKIRHHLEYYTALVENFVRALLTPIYYYTHVYHGKEVRAQLPEEYLRVGVIQKINGISSVQVSIPDVDLSLLVKGVDMRIRHGGTAHEHWKIQDDNRVQIQNVHPETGKIRDDFELSAKELSDKIKELEKLVWVLRLGFYAFLHNKKIHIGNVKPRTKDGVEQYTANFAKERVLEAVTPFSWSEETREVFLKLKYESPHNVYPGGELMMATGVYEIINKIDSTLLKYQVIDVLKFLALMVNTDKYKKFKAQVFCDDKEITTVTYALDDLMKIDKDDKFIPTPIEGNEISKDLKIKFNGEITVPKGFRAIMLEDLKKKHPDSEFV